MRNTCFRLALRSRPARGGRKVEGRSKRNNSGKADDSTKDSGSGISSVVLFLVIYGVGCELGSVLVIGASTSPTNSGKTGRLAARDATRGRTDECR